MKRFYFILITILTISCSKETNEIYSLSQALKLNLQGSWEWVSSTGGIAGITLTPTSTKIAKSIYIGKNFISYYENGVQKQIHQFSIQSKKSIYNHKEASMFVFANHQQSFEIKGRNLLLKDEIYDGFVHLYKKSNCVNCTKVFYTISVNIKNKEKKPIALDKMEVVRLDTNKNITHKLVGSEWKLHQKWGSYPIYSDAFVEQDKGKSFTINFKGYIGTKLVVNTNVLVGADCCHVFYISGDREIIVN